MKLPKYERYVYVATFERGAPLTFANSDRRCAADHAFYVAWNQNDRVRQVRRATPEETREFRKANS